jgi:hypothetical protein
MAQSLSMSFPCVLLKSGLALPGGDCSEGSARGRVHGGRAELCFRVAWLGPGRAALQNRRIEGTDE